MKRYKIFSIYSLLAVFASAQITALSYANNMALSERLTCMRAVEAVIWGMPAVSIKRFINSARQDIGGDWNNVIYFSKPMTPIHQFLTPNNQVLYVLLPITTRSGPIVVDIPSKTENIKLFGSFIDAWQTPVADVGPAGNDMGKGGKYLLLPPDYSGEIPDGYFTCRLKTYSVYAGLRPVSDRTVSPEAVVQYIKKLKIYPISQKDHPPETRYIDAYPKKWNTLPSYDISFFKDLSLIINEEPVQERDLAIMGMLASIGIIKGSDFDPDPRMVTLLSSAVKDAYDYMQWYLETPGKALVPFWGPASQWQRANIPKEQITSGFPFVTEDRLLIEERGAGVYFWATFIPKKLGGGSFYLMGLRDKDGNLFDGVSLYRLTVPHDTPAGDFWSVVAYDMETKSFFREVKQVGISSLDKDQLKVNHDGSIDIFFGPEAPTGGDANWIPTPGRFMLIFRLYGPEKRFFERTWQLPDVEKIE